MVVMYLTQWCSYCRAARQLLAEKRCEWKEIDVGGRTT
jgi:glutaredoxin